MCDWRKTYFNFYFTNCRIKLKINTNNLTNTDPTRINIKLCSIWTTRFLIIVSWWRNPKKLQQLLNWRLSSMYTLKTVTFYVDYYVGTVAIRYSEPAGIFFWNLIYQQQVRSIKKKIIRNENENKMKTILRKRDKFDILELVNSFNIRHGRTVCDIRLFD